MLRVYCYKTMTIEKTFKLTIKDAAYFLTEQEVSALYEQCRQALNISATNPNWPTYPLPNTYCGNVPFGTTTDNSVMDWHDYHGVTATGISTANVPSSKGINFLSDDLSDDMETIKDNNNWRSSVQKALDKLSAKSNITTKLNSKTNITTNDGTKVG